MASTVTVAGGGVTAVAMKVPTQNLAADKFVC